MRTLAGAVSFILFIFTLQVYPQWSNNPNNPLIVAYGQDPKICSDGGGGCYISYTYETIWYPQKLAVERLDMYGYKPWGTKKQILGELPEQWQPQIIEDNSGGTIISYLDDSSVYRYVVRVQRVDSTGNFLWNPTGVRVSMTELNHGDQQIVNDGENGAVIVWLSTQGTQNKYYINRINNSGERTWGDSGVFLMQYTWAEPPNLVKGDDQSYYFYFRNRNHLIKINNAGEIVRHDTLSYNVNSICADGNDGIIILEKSDEFYPFNIQLRARRLDPLGLNLWEPYIVAAESLHTNPYIRMARNQDYLFFSWIGKKNSVINIPQLQILRMYGTTVLIESIILTGSGGIFISDSNRTFIMGTDTAVIGSTSVGCFDTLGNNLFGGEVIITSQGLGWQNYATDGNGGLIVGGAINQFTIIVQQVNRNGQLGVVPVEMISFTGEPKENKIILKWQTATEINNKGFEIQYTSHMEEWLPIGFINGAGTTTEVQKYSFMHKELEPGKYKYRLKQIDYDGSFSYSKEIEVILYMPEKFVLYQNFPNPFNPLTTILFFLPYEDKVTLSLINILGEELQLMINEKMAPGIHEYILDASSYPSGVYIYRIRTEYYTDIKKLILLK